MFSVFPCHKDTEFCFAQFSHSWSQECLKKTHNSVPKATSSTRAAPYPSTPMKRWLVSKSVWAPFWTLFPPVRFLSSRTHWEPVRGKLCLGGPIMRIRNRPTGGSPNMGLGPLGGIIWGGILGGGRMGWGPLLAKVGMKDGRSPTGGCGGRGPGLGPRIPREEAYWALELLSGPCDSWEPREIHLKVLRLGFLILQKTKT